MNGAPLLRHRIAVERGGDRPRFAGNVEQDGSNRTAEQRAPVDARQHHDRGRGIHGEGERQQYRHAVGAAQARQHADENAEHEAHHHQREYFERQQHVKSVQQEAERFHRFFF
jgi:hypothetical protein